MADTSTTTSSCVLARPGHQRACVLRLRVLLCMSLSSYVRHRCLMYETSSSVACGTIAANVRAAAALQQCGGHCTAHTHLRCVFACGDARRRRSSPSPACERPAKPPPPQPPSPGRTKNTTPGPAGGCRMFRQRRHAHAEQSASIYIPSPS